jgi:hypothetical protein
MPEAAELAGAPPVVEAEHAASRLAHTARMTVTDRHLRMARLWAGVMGAVGGSGEHSVMPDTTLTPRSRMDHTTPGHLVP